MASRIGLVARLIGTLLLLCVTTASHAEKRVALVIGNSAYQTVPKLLNPAADARLMSDTLLSLWLLRCRRWRPDRSRQGRL